jgi:hypothetical protein
METRIIKEEHDFLSAAIHSHPPPANTVILSFLSLTLSSFRVADRGFGVLLSSVVTGQGVAVSLLMI